ncbi:hypothetical protein RB195_009728 [Necator americanus]|uniref:Uncharacterized protein n=1 Tax=Necator americanus TaxID=51031 RepID=A0ABR1CUM7_NECAM
MSSSADAMLSALDDLDRCDIATLLHHLLPRLDSLEKACQTLLERTAPKSSCLFCTVDENRDNHHSGRCPRFPDPISKTAQATKLNLCLLCLKAAHEDTCGVKCGSCGLGHNFLLCSSKRPQPPTKRPYKKCGYECIGRVQLVCDLHPTSLSLMDMRECGNPICRSIQIFEAVSFNEGEILP